MSSTWRNLPQAELQKISAYLDNELSGRDRARLQARIEQDPDYRAALNALRQTKALLGELPQVEPRRSFTLTPEMVGAQPRRTWFPSRQIATVLTALMLAIVVGVDALTAGQGESISVMSEELRAMAPPAAEQAEAPAEGEAIEALGDAESDIQEEAAEGQMQEPSALYAQGTGTPAGGAADESPPTATATAEVGARVEENGREPAAVQNEAGGRSFFSARPWLRTTEFVLGLALLGLLVSLFLRPRQPR